MLRRDFLLATAASTFLRADDRADALEVIEPLAAALSDGNVDNALRQIPDDSTELRGNIAALMAQAECISSIDVVKAQPGQADLDWYLQIRSRATGNLVDRRQGTVQLRWSGRKILSLHPATFFAPAKL